MEDREQPPDILGYEIAQRVVGILDEVQDKFTIHAIPSGLRLQSGHACRIPKPEPSHPNQGTTA